MKTCAACTSTRLVHEAGSPAGGEAILRCRDCGARWLDWVTPRTEEKPEIARLIEQVVALETRLHEWSSTFEAAVRFVEADLLIVLAETASVLVGGLTTLPDITELPSSTQGG